MKRRPVLLCWPPKLTIRKSQLALVPISRDTHARTKIRPLQSLAFAAAHTAIPLYGGEIVTMSHELPVIFLAEAGSYPPAAEYGKRSGQNLLIDDQGRWLGTHVPALWRRGPFRLARVAGSADDNMVLCIEDSSDLVNETEGQPLFDDTGAPTAIVSTATSLLSQLERDSRTTRTICEALDRLGLIVPWRLEIPQSDGRKLAVSDLFQVEEAKIATLSGDDLVTLRDVGALAVIYAHLLSLSKISLLARLARNAAERDQQKAALQKGNLNLDRTCGIVEDDPFIF